MTFLISEKAMSSFSTRTPVLRLTRLARKGPHESVTTRLLIGQLVKASDWLVIVTSLHGPGVEDWAKEDQTVQLPPLVIRVLLLQNV